MWEYFYKIFGWWILTIIKFVFTPFIMIINPGGKLHWSFLETILICASGAAIGTFIFFHFGEYIFNWMAQHLRRPKKIFTRINRRIIKVKWKYGFRGLIMLSVIISVPLASIVAAKFYRHDKRALPKLITGFFLWSVALSIIAYFIKVII
ncbi:MAG: hypothetical protein ACHQNT_11050 [Bacteroidia bacterium]